MSDASSNSMLNYLRQFRYAKSENSAINGTSATSETKALCPAPGRKRIQTIQDSDSEDDSIIKTEKRPKIELSVEDKERRFLSAVKIAPDYDPMDVQDSLLKFNWDVSQSIRYLKENFKKNGTNHNRNVSSATSHNKRKAANKAYDGDSDGNFRNSELVYDSGDDSDTEVSVNMSSNQKAVFEFMNKAPLHEMLCIKSCTEKKAALLIELRPFFNWPDLVNKLNSNKYISTELLNNCQDLLSKRKNIGDIMKKCNQMVTKLEAAIENGGGIITQPATLNPEFKLAGYQMIGLNWLTVMHNQTMNGILADEMGLGKTIQVIAFLTYLKEKGLAKGAHLIIVPSSTLDNWEVEIQKWSPSMIIEKYYGTQDERRSMRIQYAKHGFNGIDILLTTYHTVASSPEERKMFRITKLHYVIFDEAHMLKNMTTQRYAQLININAERRILLTGTPLQNNLLELMSLLCFVMPSFFGRSMEDIKSLFQKKNQKSEDGFTTFEQSQVEQAKKIMKPFFLRRLKKDVLKYLPKKTECTLKVPMTDKQKEYYKQLVDYYSNERGVVMGSSEMAGATMMMDMRKLANHPLLMRYYYSDDDLRSLAKRLAKNSAYKKDNPDYVFEDLAWMSDFQIWQICEKYYERNMDIPDDLICESGKFRKLDSLLPELKKDGHRVLIFSQFTMMLDVVERYMEIRNYGYVRLDGATNVSDRQDLIDQFNENDDIFIFLLSTKAGGMGINLTSADTVIIHDIDFNPYNDKQAEDRCHRMGQEKPVSIYRLISEGTIEEGMLMIAKDKLDLEREINEQKDDDVQEHKCMVRLLTMALGLNEKVAEQLLSPSADKTAKISKIPSLNNETF